MKTIEELYEIALFHNLVKNKSEFAKFIGSDKSTLSHALKRTAGVSIPNIVTKAEHALLKVGINTDNESGVQGIISPSGDTTQKPHLLYISGLRLFVKRFLPTFCRHCVFIGFVVHFYTEPI